ncbi:MULTISPECIES: DUF3575 domain-containing protein [unclassified Alistipes]|uniref:DUF3575 domain-containing protein n=1 Tax=unclassified Alistipes TaxID=2608932 RepID=UPI0007A7D47F|nr:MULTISPECIES: DUF3575 domain-containing protein [unclassified Alistipes]CVI70105.1 hypothetical protein BN3659_01764 [Alistipes sp. CHKCI003]
MKKSIAALAVLFVFTATALPAGAQTYVKLNGLYALAGVVNPSVEFVISPKSTVQTEIVVSPWESIGGKHMLFGILMGEYRRYFRGHNDGWYLGANAGMMAFDMSKPYMDGWHLRFEDRYCKGYGFMIGICAGYEWQFRERWVLDAFLGWSWMSSFYNGYSMDGEIDMHPHRPVQPEYPDPFNGSSEWYPNKIGLSIGYRIISPKRFRGEVQRSEVHIAE